MACECVIAVRHSRECVSNGCDPEADRQMTTKCMPFLLRSPRDTKEGRNAKEHTYASKGWPKSLLLTRIRSVPARSRPPNPAPWSSTPSGRPCATTDCWCLRPVRMRGRATSAHGPLEARGMRRRRLVACMTQVHRARDRGLLRDLGGREACEVQPGCFREGTYPSVSMQAAA